MKRYYWIVCLLLSNLGPIGIAGANHINFGDIQQVVNNYPPGRIIFNSERFPHQPFSEKDGIDIRPFCVDPGTSIEVCENDWHVLAIRFTTPVFIPKFGPLDPDCAACLQNTLGFIPAATPLEAKRFLNELEGEFCLDSREQEAVCPADGTEPEPEEEFCLNGIKVDVDRTATKRFIPFDTKEEWEGLRDFCGCEATVQEYGAQWYHITDPFDPLLSPGEHTFEAVLSFFDFFAFRFGGNFTVLSQEAPGCGG